MLRTSSPSWLTPSLLKAAESRPQRAPASAAPDLPASGYVGIRPGSEEIAPYGCTMNYVFRKDGALAIGTAGHCTDRVGQTVTLLTLEPDSNIPVIVDIGKVVVRVFDKNQLAPDFSIIAINPKFYPWVFPTQAQVLGPCGAYTGNGLVSQSVPTVFKGQQSKVGPEVLFHYGHGTGIGTGGTPRVGVSVYWDTLSFWWDSASSPGDSGSGVHTSSLAAAGDLTDLVVYSTHPGAFVEGTRITQMTKTGWQLVSSPYCP
jgi:hypothetical protein